MKIYDVSRTLEAGMYGYPGDPVFTRTPLRSGDAFISAITLGTHTGTHIDAPSHYIPGGAGIDKITPKQLITTAELVSFGGIFTCTTPAVLFRSGFLGEGYPSLSPDEAESLVSCGVRVVGTDTPSVGDDAVHRILLSAGVVIIEMLDFTRVPDGVYRMVALPLKIAGADAAPARVVLMEEE